MWDRLDRGCPQHLDLLAEGRLYDLRERKYTSHLVAIRGEGTFLCPSEEDKAQEQAMMDDPQVLDIIRSWERIGPFPSTGWRADSLAWPKQELDGSFKW
jgi:hypothetical protein